MITLCLQRACDWPAPHGEGLVLEGLSRNAARQSRCVWHSGRWRGPGWAPHSSNHVLPAVVSDPFRAEGKDEAGVGCVWLGGTWGEKLPPGGLFQEGLTARAEGPGSGVWVGREGHQSPVMSTYSRVGGLGGQLTC